VGLQWFCLLIGYRFYQNEKGKPLSLECIKAGSKGCGYKAPINHQYF
jgi:hypothetical protein